MSTDTQKETLNDDVLKVLEGLEEAPAAAPLAPGFDLGAEGGGGGEELIKLMTELSDPADARSRSTGREFGKELLAHLAGGGVVNGFRACHLVTREPLPRPETLMLSLVLTDEGFIRSAQDLLEASWANARSRKHIQKLRARRAAKVAASGVGQGARSGVSVLADGFRTLRPSLPPESDYFQGKLPYVAQMDLGALLGDANTGAYWCERIQLRPRTDGNGVILEIVFRLRGEGDVLNPLLERRVRHVLRRLKVVNLAVFDNRRSAKGAFQSRRSAKDDASPETKDDASPETKDDASPETKDDASPETKDDASPETKDDASPETKDDASPEGWLHMGIVARVVPMEREVRAVCVFNELGQTSLHLPESPSGS